MFKEKYVLVTGAGGFIGSALASRLLSDGYNVVTIENFTTGYKSNIPKGCILVEGDCQDQSTVAKLEKFELDIIYHVAGQSSGEISFENPIYDLETNTKSTLLLLNLAMKVKCKKFIYASTMSVYGDKGKQLVSEDEILSPKSFYGIGKIASEHYLRIYQEFGINSTSLRLFNVYGPGQNLNNLKQGMVSIFLAQALASKKIHVKGSKLRFRDFVYIDDVVEAFILSSKRKEFGFEILNICTGVSTSIERLILLLKRSLPFDFSVRYEGKTPGDQFGIAGNNKKASKIIGWRPVISLDNGLYKTCKWAMNIDRDEI